MKTAIVTGADGGIGSVITTQLALAGCHVIMACEEYDRASAVMEDIRQKTGGTLSLFIINLASFHSILQFVEKVTAQFPVIDILLNNAGILPQKPGVTENGIEITVGINYLGHYLLTAKLIPFMPYGGRIVNMSSFSYKWFEVRDDFFHSASKNRFRHYSSSKRALVYFTLDRAKQLSEKGISINCADPGIVNTRIIRLGNKLIDKACDLLFRPFIHTPEKGAETMVFLALSDRITGETGGYYVNKKRVKIRNAIYNSPQRTKLAFLTSEILSQHHLEL
jgi:NAD(P)-dependent dehydrogenase (short-subunit alcohol dehydrogenase family)